MPVTVEIADIGAKDSDLEQIFSYFKSVDERFSTYKPDSEISRINRGELLPEKYSEDMKTVLRLSEETKKETDGYFDIFHDGVCDPSGLVKGWAIQRAAALIERMGFKYFFVEAGGDIQVSKTNGAGEPWKVGLQNPFSQSEIIKVVFLGDRGVATSGTYVRGQHIYNPKKKGPITEIVSLTVIGPNIYEADRFATAAFAMGKKGINFVESLAGFEGYIIDKDGLATMTTGFDKYTKKI